MKRLIYFCATLFFLVLTQYAAAQNREIEGDVFQSNFGAAVPQMIEKPQTASQYELPLGYRAMVEMGGGCASFYYGCLGMTTTHGYQFNQNIYLGGLVGFLVLFDDALWPVVAVDFRTYMGKNSIHKPWVGLTLGFPQAQVSFGMRFALNRKNALNIALHAGLCTQFKLGFEF